MLHKNDDVMYKMAKKVLVVMVWCWWSFVAANGGEGRWALGVVRLSLEKNIAFNVVNEKTTFGLLKALSNMYEKPSVSNKVFLINQLVNTKTAECVDIKFDDEMKALLWLSSLPDRWPGHIRSQCEAVKGVVNVSIDVSDDAMLCCVEEYCESSVKDVVNVSIDVSDDVMLCCIEEYYIKVLDIAAIGDVVLKTTFGTEWTMKNVRYILSLKRKLIYVWQLDNEGYHIGFGDQMWKVTRGSQVIARGCKQGTLCMVEIPVMEWTGGNLIEDVDREAEKKNIINERLRGRLCRKLELKEKSTWEPLSEPASSVVDDLDSQHEEEKQQKVNDFNKVFTLEDDTNVSASGAEVSSSLSNPNFNFQLPSKIATMLYPHQRKGLNWLWSLHCKVNGGILGDDMGLGKTMQICSFLVGLFHSNLTKRVLVVALKTLLPHWKQELAVVDLAGKTKEYNGTCYAKARHYELQHIL
ncbi:SNF2-related, N-terminal domain-containing protein [Tanacetum coccineum]